VVYLVAFIAGTMSYGHQVALGQHWDFGTLTLGGLEIIEYAYLAPLTVDALAFIGQMIRNSDDVEQAARRAALVPLILAGAMSVAANVAMATNVAQVVVGVWTVASYLIAEYFVSRMKRRSASESTEPRAAVVKATDAEKTARKRAGYAAMSRVEKAAWTKQYRERVAKRTESAAPTSPGRAPVANAPSAAQLDELVGKR
jgi:hypothetical protein